MIIPSWVVSVGDGSVSLLLFAGVLTITTRGWQDWMSGFEKKSALVGKNSRWYHFARNRVGAASWRGTASAPV